MSVTQLLSSRRPAQGGVGGKQAFCEKSRSTLVGEEGGRERNTFSWPP